MGEIRNGPANRTPFRRLSARISRRYYRAGVPGGPPPESDFSLGVPFEYPLDLHEQPKIGAMVHMFHPEVAEEFAAVLRHLGPDAKVMLSTDTDAKRQIALDAFRDWTPGTVEVRLVENRGRDIAAYLTAFTDRYDEFDLVLFLHSKLTDYSPFGRGWREILLAGLVGSEGVVQSIRAVFEAEPRTGLVFSQHYEPVRPCTGWESNFPAAQKLAREWGLRLRMRGQMDFPSGGMFWARPAALRPILDLGLTAADFPPEGGFRDGTIGHAIERLFALAAEYAGYTWFKVAAPEWFKSREAIVTPRSEGDLREFLVRHERQLMKTMVH